MSRIYSGQLLRNFQSEFLQEVLKGFFERPKDFNKVWKETLEENGWLKASNIIERNEIFNDERSLLRLENILYNELFNNVSDNIHLFPISLRNRSIETIKEKFLEKPLPLNEKINTVFENPLDFQTVSVKVNPTRIDFLFRFGLTKDEDNKKVIFMIPCSLDLNNQFIQIKFKNCFKSKSLYNTSEILTKVIQTINNFNIVDVYYLSRPAVKSIYFNMFKDESERAEAIIKNRAGIQNTELIQSEAENFLNNTFSITNQNSEYFDTYVKKMMSMYYHQHALHMEDTNFGDRFMFAFSFYDGHATRSSTRNSDKKHVYTGNLYWTLKDIILQKESISSISMYYKFNPSDFSFIGGNNYIGVEINLKESSSFRDDRSKAGFLIEFLNTNNRRRDSQRGIKNEYIIHEIKRYFPNSPDL